MFQGKDPGTHRVPGECPECKPGAVLRGRRILDELDEHGMLRHNIPDEVTELTEDLEADLDKWFRDFEEWNRNRTSQDRQDAEDTGDITAAEESDYAEQTVTGDGEDDYQNWRDDDEVSQEQEREMGGP